MRDWEVKRLDYEIVRARHKARQALKACGICGEPSTFNCVCGTIAYCSQSCRTVDWRDRGHREACERIRDERAAAARGADAAAPSPPPEEVFYGPAPRSRADEARARIAAEHEAARARREANPEPEPLSARHGSRCPIGLEEWDVNASYALRVCCCRKVCLSCLEKIGTGACPLCRIPRATTDAENLARLRRHVENEVPEAITHLGSAYKRGWYDLVKSDKKAAKIYRRAVELGDVDAMLQLAELYRFGSGVKLDKKKGERLWRMAADRGDAAAQSSFAILLDCEQRIEEAFRYYALAADQGLTVGEVRLGYCYAHGEGTELDLGKARYWLERAAAKGDEEAIESLAHLDARV